jgi:hypothetical protein
MHVILYELIAPEAMETYVVAIGEWSRRVIKHPIHAPHSPSLGVWIWPPA